MSDQPCPHLYRHLIAAPVAETRRDGTSVLEVCRPGASAADLRRLQVPNLSIVCWECGAVLPPAEGPNAAALALAEALPDEDFEDT